MICVGLGSNLGSREAFLVAAELLLRGRDDVEVLARSRLYLTPPVGPPQPDYLNAALRLRTDLHPRDLLPALQEIEHQLGRQRVVRWGPRTLDADILHWTGEAVDEPGLTVPHARLADRAFAVAPLLDVAPELSGRYACTAPPVRAWSRRPEDTLDETDELAFATTETLGRPPRASQVRSFQERLPERGPGFVVLERWDAEVRRGSKLL